MKLSEPEKAAIDRLKAAREALRNGGMLSVALEDIWILLDCSSRIWKENKKYRTGFFYWRHEAHRLRKYFNAGE